MSQIHFTFGEALRITGGIPLGPFDPEKVFTAVSTDTRESMPDALFIALKGDSFDAHLFLADAVRMGAVLLCIDRGESARLPDGVPAIGVDSTLSAYQAVAAAHRAKFPDLRVAALTGSCGKTGTKEALRAIFNAAFGKDHVLATEGNTNNQIGVPRNLLRLTSEHRIAVLEAGTNHHGEIAPLAACIRPDNALIVSIRSCHLENLGSLEGVAQEKSNIFSTLPPEGGGVIPYSCAGGDILRKALAGHRILTFGPEPEADYRAEYLGGDLHGASFRLHVRATGEEALVHWSVPGAHQASNAAGAAALASFFGVSLAKAAEGLSGTTLPGMRMRVTEHGGATWINDAYNANPDSMAASLGWLHEFADDSKLVLALGDMLELGTDSHKLHAATLAKARELFPRARIIAIGERMTAVGRDADIFFPDSKAAAKEILSCVKPGDTVFLKASRSTKLELLEPEGA